MSKSSEFGKKMAKVMLNTPSSHSFFFVQQAYKGKKWGKFGELMTWEEAAKILKEVIDDKTKRV